MKMTIKPTALLIVLSAALASIATAAAISWQDKNRGATLQKLASTIEDLNRRVTELDGNIRHIEQQKTVTAHSTHRETPGDNSLDLAFIAEEFNNIHDRIDQLEKGAPISTPEEEHIHPAANSPTLAEIYSDMDYSLDDTDYEARAVESAIIESFSNNDMAGVLMSDIDCRAKTCKVDLQLADQSSANIAAEKVIGQIRQDHQHQLIMKEDGVQIYFSLD